MTPGLRAILQKVDAGHGIGVPIDPCNDRATAVRLKLIEGKRMKVGHGKKYYLTEKGRKALGVK